MATIAVSITKPRPTPTTQASHTGFAAGLAGGWHALGRSAAAAATAVGALLPWAVVTAVLGVPLWWARRWARRQARRRRLAGRTDAVGETS